MDLKLFFDLEKFQENANGPPKMKPFNCFLFEQSVIFSETVGKKTTQTSYKYEYKAHFLVSLDISYHIFTVHKYLR